MKWVFLLTVLICTVGIIKAKADWLWNFDGTIGDERVGFTLVSTNIAEFPRGTNLQCSYFYVKDLKDINLRCNVERNGDITFEEFDGAGKVTAVFRGRFLKNDIDNAEGAWTKKGEADSKPFKLKLLNGAGGNLSHRYAMIDAKNDAKFESQVQAFKNAVLQGDKQKVVSFIRFPIKVQMSGKTVVIKNRPVFLQKYETIFNPDFIEVIRQSVPHNMLIQETSAVLGAGNVRFYGNGKVIAISN